MAIAEQIINHEGEAIYFDDRCVSYEELRHVAFRMANFLGHFAHPARVVFQIDNTWNYVPFFIGCVLQGARPFLLHPGHTGNDRLIAAIKPDLIISNADELMQRLEKEEIIFEVMKPRDAACELFTGFTSGTTGLPKGYRRTEQSWLDSFKLNDEIFKLTAFNHYVAGGPLYHSLTLFAAISALYAGKTIHLSSKFSAALPSIQDAVIFGVPSMLEMMLEHASSNPYIFLSSGAKLEPHTLAKAAKQFPNMRIYEYFGSSEASYISYLTPEDRALHPNSVGKFFPAVTYEIDDTNELWLQSPYMFTGYFGNPDVTGMIATGDIARVEDGFLYLLGRKKNRLIVGGRNVFPEEVERVIRELGVLEVMVTGKRHYLLGEVPVAIIKPAEQFDLEQAKEVVKAQLEKYKRPLKWIIDEEFIYTSSGKVARHDMKVRHHLE